MESQLDVAHHDTHSAWRYTAHRSRDAEKVRNPTETQIVEPETEDEVTKKNEKKKTKMKKKTRMTSSTKNRKCQKTRKDDSRSEKISKDGVIRI